MSDHADPKSPWDDEVRAQEDAGQIHTDDCISYCLFMGDDDFESCTSGWPGSNCRVKTIGGGP